MLHGGPLIRNHDLQVDLGLDEFLNTVSYSRPGSNADSSVSREHHKHPSSPSLPYSGVAVGL